MAIYSKKAYLDIHSDTASLKQSEWGSFIETSKIKQLKPEKNNLMNNCEIFGRHNICFPFSKKASLWPTRLVFRFSIFVVHSKILVKLARCSELLDLDIIFEKPFLVDKNQDCILKSGYIFCFSFLFNYRSILWVFLCALTTIPNLLLKSS